MHNQNLQASRDTIFNTLILTHFKNLAATFDLHSINENLYFPKVTDVDNESIILHTNLLNSLYRKNTQLNPSNVETSSLNELVSKVMTILDRMMMVPIDHNKFKVKEAIQVGSFKNGTMRTGRNDADIVVMLDMAPTTNLIQELSIVAHSMLNDIQGYQIVPKFDCMSVEVTQKGFDIFNECARVSLLIATYPKYFVRIYESNLRNQVEINLAAVRHSKFLEEKSNPFTKILSRVLRFIIERNDEFCLINPWMIDAFSCYAIFSNYSNQPLSLNQAFLRVFQLLSSGIFSPNSGIMDPCENFQRTINYNLSNMQQEVICEAAQKILNKILAGKVDEVLELKD